MIDKKNEKFSSSTDLLSDPLSDSLSDYLKSKSSLIRFSISFFFIMYLHSSKSV